MRIVCLLSLLALCMALNIQEDGYNPFTKDVPVTGYIDLNDKDAGKLFYWLWESRSAKKDTDPLVFWFTGGPGCSSELAAFMENGPYMIQKDLSLKTNPYSWNNNANVAYVD